MKRLHLAKRGVSSYTLNPKIDNRRWWLEAVLFALQNDLHLEQMIRTRFNIASLKDCVPPASLAQEKYLASYQAANELIEEDIRCQLSTEKQAYRTYVVVDASRSGYKGKELHKYALLNDDIQVSPLFKYCLASSMDIDFVMRRYRNTALAQYLMMPSVYDREWPDWITDDLKKFAIDFYRGIKGASSV